MRKRIENHGSGRYGVVIETATTISKNWFVDKATRDINYERVSKNKGKTILSVKKALK